MRAFGPVLALAALLAACGPRSEPAPASPPSIDTSSNSPFSASSALVTPEIEAAVKALPAPYNAADYANGRRVFAQCRSCHMIEAGAGNSVGPNLHGVFGRKAASLPGFSFSAALQNAGWTWDEAQLDKWIENPQRDLPGTRMTFAGVRKPDDRRDLIAYLKVETSK